LWFLGKKVTGFEGIFEVSRLQGFEVSWNHGFEISRSQGFRVYIFKVSGFQDDNVLRFLGIQVSEFWDFKSRF
jgi:hypothetical protein